MADVLVKLVSDGKVHVTGSGCFVSETLIRQKLSGKFVDGLLSKLSAKPVVTKGYKPPIQMYKRIKISNISVLMLPRDIAVEFGKVLGGAVITIAPSPLIRTPIPWTGDLFPNQQLVVDTLLTTRFSTGIGTATLDLQAGRGKTAVSLAIAHRLGYRTLYIVKGIPLQKQAVGEAKVWCTGAKVCGYESKKYDKNTPIESFDIVVMVVNTALMQDHKFFSKFGFVIVDEIHLFCSPIRSKLFWELSSVPCVLVMSGTTGERPDHMDVLYQRHFGDIIYANKIPGYSNDEVVFTGSIDVVRFIGNPKYTKPVTNATTGDLSAVETIEVLCECPARTQFVVDELVKLWRDPTRHIIAFAEHRDYLTLLAAKIKAEIGEDVLVESETPADTLMGSDKKSAEIVASKSRIILTTYGYGGTGLSLSQLNTEFLITPRRNGHRQFLARITRRNGDPTIPRKVIDIWDVSSALKSQYYGRSPVYDGFGWPVASRTVKHSDIRIAR